jgi:UDP-glucose 4-epimerase
MHKTLKSFYTGKKVLITGGASFIGSHLSELLLSSGAGIRIVDDLSSGKLENIASISGDIEFFRGDLRDRSVADMACQGRQIVFHLAASHGGRGYIETHPVECMNNMLLDHQVFDAAAKAGAEKIVHASSACTYPTTLQASENDRNLLRETDANFSECGKAFSDGEYGWAKLMGEMQLRAFHKQYGLSGVACRIFTAYGERENESHAVVALIAKAAAKMDPYPVWGNGLQTRNFTYVADTAAGIALAGAKLSGFEAINIGSQQHHTILDLTAEIFKTLGWKPSRMEYQLDKPVGVKSRASDNEKCRKLLGWEPSFSLADGVSRTARWYVAQLTPEKLAGLQHSLMERN